MKIYELLDSPEKWTQCCDARDKNGAWVDPLSTEAVCWCLFGAAKRCYKEEELDVVIAKMTTKLPHGIVTYNDIIAKNFEEVREFVTKLGV